MIDARIQLTATTHDEQMEELLERGRELGRPVVRVEVEYPSETAEGGSWDESGDALQIDFTTDPPTVETLPPYTEVTG